MDYSIQDVMNDLVAADAARMSGARFADARGTGVARRVRTRRTVRAAGVGGASAVAVGALALGATRVPWGAFDAAPGIGAIDCANLAPSDDENAYELVIRKGDTPGDTVTFTDLATGAPFLTATLDADGTYVFTDADGNPLRATAEENALSTDADGNPLMSAADKFFEVYWVVGPQVPSKGLGTTSPGAEESYVMSIFSSDSYGFPRAVARARDACLTASPTPSDDFSVSVTSSPDASLAAKPDEVEGSPFECAFEFHSSVRESAAGSVAGYEWVDPETMNASLIERWGTDANLPQVKGTSPVPVAHVLLVGEETPDVAISVGVGTPQDQAKDSLRSEDTLFVGASFVQVRDGVVVGTMKVDLESAMTNFSFASDSDHNAIDLALIDANNAFLACPGKALEAPGLSTYAVAGSYIGHPASTDVTPTEYSWAAIEAE